MEIFEKIFSRRSKRRQHGRPSNASENSRPGAGPITPNPQPRPETGCLEPSTESSQAPFPGADVVLHNSPHAANASQLTSYRYATDTVHEQSEVGQRPSLRQTAQDPETSSTSDIGNEQPQSLRMQQKEAPPQLEDTRTPPQVVRDSLWEEAADSLDKPEREKLDRLIKSKREGQEGDSHPSIPGGDLSADDVSVVLARAQALGDKDKAWSPVRCAPTRNSSEAHT